MQILQRFDRSIFRCPTVSLPSPFSFSLGRVRAYNNTQEAEKTMGSHAKLARRLLETDTPVMIQMQELLRSVKDCMSLAQGVVHWPPPDQALEKTKDAIWQPSTSNYGPDEGLPDLREALVEKLRRENKLCKSSVMVTAGANQASLHLYRSLLLN